jgi:hypothetical protein
MTAYEHAEIQLQACLISASDRGELSEYRPWQDRDTGNSVSPRAGLDVLDNGQISCPCGDSTHDSWVILPTA